MAKAKWQIEKTPAEGMGTTYVVRLAPGEKAKALLTPGNRTTYNLAWIQVPPKYRGQGISNVLMKRILADADKNGVTLTLTARACAGLTQEALERWYLGWGFGVRGYDDSLKGTKMLRAPKIASARGYRRNIDESLREVERALLSDPSPTNYLAYLHACRRAGLMPAYCHCLEEAVQPCNPCSEKHQVAVFHCLEHASHRCSGEVHTDAGPIPCSTDLDEARICVRCEERVCENTDCTLGEQIDPCTDCEALVCSDDDCAVHCENCNDLVCSECWFNCEAHEDQKFCSDCTSSCEVCGRGESGTCCPQCVCKECEVGVCTSCVSTDKAHVCNTCDERLCPEHAKQCHGCQAYTCEEHQKTCKMRVDGKPCGEIFCESCDLEPCSKCNKEGCAEHFEECPDCGEQFCDRCMQECEKCGNSRDADCIESHDEVCQELPDPVQSPPTRLVPTKPTPIKSIPQTLQEGSRVRHLINGIQGTVVKIGQKDGVWKCIIEWDDDTASKHTLDEVAGPLRRYFRY